MKLHAQNDKDSLYKKKIIRADQIYGKINVSKS